MVLPRILKGRPYHAGSALEATPEQHLDKMSWVVHKFNNRPDPGKDGRLIICCFSEFGCESIALQYCMPRICQQYPSAYKVAVGWYGRQYLYRHLVDEYWELSEDCQFLREWVRAFHHESKNLTRMEKRLSSVGHVIPSTYMGNICLGNKCCVCGNYWGDMNYAKECPKCHSTQVQRSIFGDIRQHKPMAVPIPRPGQEALERARQYIRGPNPVGIFARHRATYGRNLPPEFYQKLIDLYRSLGFTPVWLGEKQTTLPCPDSDVVDFSRMPESRDLEMTLAIISQCMFTAQFWTASTRLAAMMGVPYLLFESPDQICGNLGQEGIRLALVTQGQNKKKLVLCNYRNLMADLNTGLAMCRQAVVEMGCNNWDDIIGLVDEPDVVRGLMAAKNYWQYL